MGFGLPATIGAKVAAPKKMVIDIDGDASFSMTAMELATASQFNIGVKVIVLNNDFQGMVLQWQDLFYEKRYSHTAMTNPDFVKLAEAYGCAAFRCEGDDDVDATIRKALDINDRPVLIDFTVSPDAMVWPMVPAGVSNDAVQIAKDTSPDWNTEE